MPPPFSQRLAPLLLRLSLGATFLWAGFGKIYATFDVSGRDAAVLANMGVITPAGDTRPAPKDEPKAKPESKPADPTRPAPTEPAEKPRNKAGGPPPLAALAPPPGKTYSADDFPSPVSVRRVYGVALVVHNAAHPAAGADGKTPMPLWPRAIGGQSWPVYAAWAVTVAELGGGFLVLAGFLTRLGGVFIAGAMAGAMWLTEIGPAVQSGKTWLGFLPDHGAFDGPGSPNGTYMMLLWQFALFTVALAVALLGPGLLSLDALVFGRPPEPKPPPARPAAT